MSELPLHEVVDRFRDAIQSYGLEPPEVIEPGKWTRFPGQGKGPRNTAGSCRLFQDLKGGVICDHSTGLKETWFVDSKARSPQQVRKYQKQAEQARIERQETETEKHERAAAEAQDMWGRASPALDMHPYLKCKRIKPHNLRATANGELLAPVYDRDGKLSSLQRIYERDGKFEKRFLPGGATSEDRHFMIGGPDEYLSGNTEGMETICIAEGIATAATIHEATGHPTVVAFGANKLEPVAVLTRERYPNARITVCADNDSKTAAEGKGNPGVEQATKAARSVGAYLAIPPADEGESVDFNDLSISKGEADDTGEKAASAAAKRWVEDERRKVFIAWPPPHNDFNDILHDPLSECSLIERIKFEESKATTLSTKDLLVPETTGDHSVFDLINTAKETYNHVGDDETNLITNDPPHPILEIIKNAKEIRDPLEEIVDKLEAGSLTPDELLSDGVMELVALRREKEGGTTFCENLRKEVLAQKICRSTVFDEALQKKLKPIREKERKEEKLRRHNQIVDNYKKSENTTEKDYEWRKELQCASSRAGFPYELNSAFNLKLYLCNDPDIKGTFRLNEKTCRVEVTKAIPASEIKWTETRSLTDEDISAVQVWFSENRLQFGASLIAQQIKNVAAENAYNPLVDWLKSLPPWDGTKRLHEVMPKGWSTVDNAYTREVGELLIKGIVARIMHPGCEFRLVPILIGRQWIGKSASLKALVGDRWVTDEFIKPGSKDTLQLLRDYVIAELGEMDVLRRAEAEELKQFISSRYDDIRDPYAREPKRHPRSCILVGTSNQSAKGLLNDPGENTRFLPLQILDKVDFDFIKANKDRWFAEALAWLQKQEIEKTFFNLSKEALVIADELRDEYRTEEPLEEAIMEFAFKNQDGFTNEQCAQYLVETKKASHVQYLKTQIGTVMIKNKYKKKRAPRGHFSDNPNYRPWIYLPSEGVAEAKTTEAVLDQQKPTEADLKFCVNCKHSRTIINENGQGRCNKKGINIPLFTHLPGGCELYEDKKDNMLHLRTS